MHNSELLAYVGVHTEFAMKTIADLLMQTQESCQHGGFIYNINHSFP